MAYRISHCPAQGEAKRRFTIFLASPVAALVTLVASGLAFADDPALPPAPQEVPLSTALVGDEAAVEEPCQYEPACVSEPRRIIDSVSTQLSEILEDEADAISDMIQRVYQQESDGHTDRALLLAKEAIDRAAHFQRLIWQLQREESERQLRALREELAAIKSNAPSAPPLAGPFQPTAAGAMAQEPAASQIVLKVMVAKVSDEAWPEVRRAIRIEHPRHRAQPLSKTIESLLQKKLITLTCAPTLVTVSGRAAQLTFEGSSIARDQSEGELQIEALPTLAPENTIRTELRVRELRRSAADGVQVRVVHTGLDMQNGETIVLPWLTQDSLQQENENDARLILLTAERVNATAPSPERRR